MGCQRLPRLVSGAMWLGLALGSQACAPMFTDARLVGKGRAEVTPHVSAAGFAARGESEHLANNFGVQVIGGVHDRVDIGAGFVRTQSVGGEDGLNLVGFGAKFGFYDRRPGGVTLALATPFGFAFGEGVDTSESFQFSPALLATFPVSDYVDINPSARVVIAPFCDSCDTLLGFNFGVGLGPADKRIIVRPEFGVLVNPGESGVGWFVGGGVSFRR